MTTWVLLRGLMRESRHWGPFTEQWKAAFPDARVLTPDLPGNGRRNRETSPTHIPDAVDAIRAELLAADAPPPYHLLALSLGAMVATSWAMQHAAELRGMVLINTSLKPFAPPHWRLHPRNWPRLVSRFLQPRNLEQEERLLLSMVSRDRVKRDDTQARWVSLAQSHPVSRSNTLRQLLAAARFHATTQQPAVPTLVLASTNDQLVDVRASRTLATAWHCPLLEHPTAGHDLPLDDGTWVQLQVAAWLSELGGAGDSPYFHADAHLPHAGTTAEA